MTNWPSPESCRNLSGHQAAEYAKATAGVLGILAGRPGSGKTFTVASIIRALGGGGGTTGDCGPHSDRIAACAPTGKAAVRMTESLQAAGVENLKAKTIHSLLRVTSADGGFQFEHDESNPLPYDYIFMDEASMLDVDLAAAFFAARGVGSHVLLVGDPGQLSPVGHGAPLRDLMAAGLPTGHLVEIQRNSGRIVQACKEIAETERFTVSPRLDLATGENLLWIEQQRPERQIAALEALLKRLAGGGKYDPVWDVQILVPVNRKSPLARKTLNKHLQGLLNPTGKRVGDNPFRVGDKIINLKNGFLPAEEDKKKKANQGKRQSEGGERKHYVANGELAKVERVEPRYTVARMTSPERLVRIPRGGGDNGNGNGSNGNSNQDEKKSTTGCNWDLGYAISCHKSQGSEWPIVVVMIDEYPGAVRLCTREWIYTALSRAKTFCVGIGRKQTALAMCRKSGIWQRKTFLRESIEGLRLAAVEQAWDVELAGVTE